MSTHNDKSEKMYYIQRKDRLNIETVDKLPYEEALAVLEEYRLSDPNAGAIYYFSMLAILVVVIPSRGMLWIRKPSPPN